MSDDGQVERCLWPVEGNELGQCGKPVVGESAEGHPLFTPNIPMPVCQEHLGASHHGSAGTDID